MRPHGRAAGVRDQRGQGPSGQRSDDPVARRRCRRQRRGDRAQRLSGRRRGRRFGGRDAARRSGARRDHRAGPGPVGHRRQRQGGQASGGRRRPARRQRACHRSADALGPGRTGARHQDLGRQEKTPDAAHRLS